MVKRKAKKKTKKRKRVTNADLAELMLRRRLAQLETENEELKRRQ